jgi:hypothetical protein
VKRRCGPMDKNRIQGVGDHGERTTDREAVVIKETLRKFGGRAPKVNVLTWGDLALGLKGLRGHIRAARSQQRP